MSKPLPKSLHTVTVLYRLALAEFERDSSQSAESCVAHALDLLGYPEAGVACRRNGGNWQVDPHALAGQAADKLRATFPSTFACMRHG